jgi:PiT family inorganic phosphate transporter
VVVVAEPVAAAGEQLLRSAAAVQVKLSSEQTCREFYCGRFAGVPVSAMVDAAHYLTAGAVSFARGLSDTPKIVALLLAGSFLAPAEGVAVVAVAMALGGWLSARRVATTMSFRVTTLNPGQGFASNLTSSLLVIYASRWGLPVSTTHVTVGSLCGIGAISGQVQTRMVSAIVLAWLVTLPVAAGLAAVAASLLVG